MDRGTTQESVAQTRNRGDKEEKAGAGRRTSTRRRSDQEKRVDKAVAELRRLKRKEVAWESAGKESRWTRTRSGWNGRGRDGCGRDNGDGRREGKGGERLQREQCGERDGRTRGAEQRG